MAKGDFPDGTCSVPCSSDFGCPSGTKCIDKEGGVCLLLCQSVADCRGNYKCQPRDHFKIGGQSSVCIE